MDTALRWFRLAAIAEACSWAGLLVGMFLKRVMDYTDIGVKIFGPIHGMLFIAYLITLGLARTRHVWPARITIFGVLAAIPPFTSLWFERVLTRRLSKSAYADQEDQAEALAGTK